MIGALVALILDWISNHVIGISLIIAVYSSLTLTCFGLLLLRPLWILQINDAIKPYSDFTLPNWLGGVKLPLGYIFLVQFFQHHPRVLNAWVAEHIHSARENFGNRKTVAERGIHVTIPAVHGNEDISELTNEDLRYTFSSKRTTLLIWGEGGSGKTSLACQIAKWAMEQTKTQRLCKHLMLPVLIEDELDNGGSNSKRILIDTIAGQLNAMLGLETSIADNLLIELLRRRRVLVVIDGFSEMSQETRNAIRPDHRDFLVNALVITSRSEEALGGVPNTALSVPTG
jgi:hypothetical protein